MNKYFEAVTPEGLVQITNNTVCYTFKEKRKLGSYPLSIGGQVFGDDDFGRTYHKTFNYQISQSNNSSDDLFFMHNPSETGVAIISNFNSATYSKYEYPYDEIEPPEKVGWWISVWGAGQSTTDNLEVYVFSKDVSRRENAGFECFDKDGKIIFSSCSVPLKVVLFNELIHTTSSQIVWTGDWTMQRPQHVYAGPIGVWMLAAGGGGTGGRRLGYTKHAHFFLKPKSVKISWINGWETEHDNVRAKWWYSNIYKPYGRETRYIIADLSNVRE